MLIEADCPAIKADQGDTRSAAMAGRRLGMKTPIGGIAIFGKAGLAHIEGGHRRLCAVIGHAVDDAQARPAMRAVGERDIGTGPRMD